MKYCKVGNLAILSNLNISISTNKTYYLLLSKMGPWASSSRDQCADNINIYFCFRFNYGIVKFTDVADESKVGFMQEIGIFSMPKINFSISFHPIAIKHI